MPYADPARQREYQREWIAERRASWLRENGPCVDCGTWERLEVDHADAAAKVTHRVWSWSAGRRAMELAKCVARCEPCHAVKSAAENARGEAKVKMHKLTEVQVKAIRRSGQTCRALGRQYGIGFSRIAKIKRGEAWPHIPLDGP